MTLEELKVWVLDAVARCARSARRQRAILPPPPVGPAERRYEQESDGAKEPVVKRSWTLLRW